MIQFSYLVRAGLALALVLAGLTAMLVQNEMARSQGRELVLEIVPVDPRDVFFGHYAILTYEAFIGWDSDLNLPEGHQLGEGDTIYVALNEGPRFATPDRPVFADLDAARRNGAPFLEARLRVRPNPDEDAPDRFHADYGLPPQYFADPETAMALQNLWQVDAENRANDEPGPQFGVIVSVSQSGKAVIKGLDLDGDRVYDTLTGPRLQLSEAE